MYTTFITTKDVAAAYINSKHGWAVAEQFEAIFEDSSEDNLQQQNRNALNYIRQSLTDLIKSGVLSADASDELVEVAEGLTQHFQWNA